MTASGGAPGKKGNKVQHLVTQDTRFQIIQNILAHPESLPSLRELEYVVDKGRSTIYEHLETLEDAGITDRFELEGVDRDQPSTFYGLTPYGLQVIDELDLFNDIDLLRGMYAAMDKPDEVQAYEGAPRPEKATQQELESELADYLETIDETEGELDEQTQRRIEGLSYTLKQSSGAGFETSAAQELGQRLLNVLNDLEAGPQVLDGLRDIAEVAPEAIAPITPRLIDLLDETNGECQTKALQVLAAIATSEETSFDTDVRERLTNLDIFTLINELPVKEALSLTEGLDELYDEIGATEARARAMFALGQYAGQEARSQYSSKDDVFETAIQAFDAAASQYEQLGDTIGQAKSLHLLGLYHFFADNDPVAEPFSEAASLFIDEGESESAARVYAHLSVLRAKNDKVEDAANIVDRIESLDEPIDNESTHAVVAAAKALIKANRGNIEEAISLLEKAEIADADKIDKSIFGSVQLKLAYIATESGYPEAAMDLAESAQVLAEETETKQAIAHAKQTISQAYLRLGRLEEAKEHLEAAVECFNKIGDTISAVDSLQQLAYIQIIGEEFGTAASNIERGLNLLDEGATAERADLQLTLADIHLASGDVEALETTLKSVEKLLESEDTVEEQTQADLHRHWGEMRMSKDDPDAAINHFREAVEQYTATENLPSAITTQLELADSHRELHEYDEAVDWLNTALELSEEADRDLYRAIALFKKTEVYRDCGDLEAALETIQVLLDSPEQLPTQPIVTGHARLKRGSILADMDRYDEARESLTEALSMLSEEDSSTLVVDVLRTLVQIAVETEQSEQVISWCQSAESYIDSRDDTFSPETKLYFVETRARHQSPEAGVEDLLYVGLRYLHMDRVDEALQPLREAWNYHTELDSVTNAYTAALSAGVGFVGATRLVTLDEAQAAGAEVLEELETHADGLSDPASYLYQFLAESTDTHSNLELEAAERIEGDYSRLSELEAVVFRDLVEQLRSSDNDFESDPTEPIKSALGSTAAAAGKAVQRQVTNQSPGSAANVAGQRRAD